jgi:hypothetical protein
MKSLARGKTQKSKTNDIPSNIEYSNEYGKLKNPLN